MRTRLEELVARARQHSDEHPNDVDYRLLAELGEELLRLTSFSWEINPPQQTWAAGHGPPQGAAPPEHPEGV